VLLYVDELHLTCNTRRIRRSRLFAQFSHRIPEATIRNNSLRYRWYFTVLTW
jgi:hypothetical protein